MNHFTSIEQSKKLLELGLKAESADMIYRNTINLGNLLDTNTYKILVDNKVFNDDIPCWSTGALMKIVCEQSPTMVGWSNTASGLFSVKTGKERAVYFDNIYEVVEYLLQNNYIKTE